MAKRALRIVRDGMEPLILLVAVIVLRQFGLGENCPLPVLAGLLLAGVAWEQTAVQRWVSGNDPARRLGLRVGVAVLLVSTVLYLIGWGPLLALAGIVVVTNRGSYRAWKPAAVASILALVAGQVLVEAGVLRTHLPLVASHGLAVLLGAGTVLVMRRLGLAAAELERAEARVRLGEERFRALVRDGSEVIVTADAEGNVSWVSPAALPIMGYPAEELHGQVLRGLYHPEDASAVEELHVRLLAGDSTVEHSAELRVRHADGTWHWHEISARNMLAHPSVRAIVSHQRDITERRVVQDKIAYAASHDSLTGLANGPTLKRDLERALAHGTRYQYPVAMLFCDLDGFKAVNDAYGHDVGDRLLQAVSVAIKQATRETDSAGRLGGDEFGVVLTKVRTADEAMVVAQRLIEEVAAHAVVAGLKLDVGCSVGIALAHPGGTDAKTLMRHADSAMYRSKRRGRNGALVYVDEEINAPWL